MCGHLTEAQDRVLALQTVVMCLFLVMVAALDATRLRRGELLEACGVDGVSLLVLATMRHNLVGVGTHEVALETMEV